MKKIIFWIALVALFSCTQTPRQPEPVNESTFTGHVDGKQIKLFTLNNSHGLVVQITNFGGRVVSLWVPDKNGNFHDIVTD